MYPPVPSSSYGNSNHAPPSSTAAPAYPPPPYGAAPPSSAAAPPAYDYGSAPPYAGFAPPIYDAPPSGFHAGPPPPVNVSVVIESHKLVANYKPLSYESSFIAFLRSSRHRNKYVCLTQHFELVFTDKPLHAWSFILSPSRNSYYICSQWQPLPSNVLQLKVAPTPLFLRANRNQGWSIGRCFGVHGPETTFFLENHGGSFAIRNAASAQFLSAEDHGLRANRKEFKDWEKFTIDVVHADQSLSLLTPFGPIAVPNQVPMVDVAMSYHVAFRARVRANRNNNLLGYHHNKVEFSSHDVVWEFLPTPHRNSFFVRNADHPNIYWHATAQDTAIKPGACHERDSEFELEFHGSHYFIRSVATGKFGSADGSRVVCNRDSPQGWEAFSLEIMHQID